MGYGTDGLTFNVLREANRRRQQEWPGNEKASFEFRVIEVAGEYGELCEAIKKFLRAEYGIKGTSATKEDIAAEIGDLLVSLDLLADKLGIDLGEAVRRKFNATSEKYGMRTYLSATDWHLKPVDAISEQDLGRKVSSVAEKILKDPKASKKAKSVAAYALLQKPRSPTETTGKAVASRAAKILKSSARR